jgi:hypothetical protein
MGMSGALLRPKTSGHPEALAWRSAVIANGGTVSASTMAAVTTFCRSIDSAGLRGRFYRLNLFCGDGLSAVLVPLYRGQSRTGTQYGNTADTNVNFVSGDYTLASGLTGNGSNKYLGLALKPGQLAVDSAQWDAWTPTLVNSAAAAWTGTAQDEDDAIEIFLSYLVFRLSRFSNSDRMKKPTVGILDRNFFEYLGRKKAVRETIFVSNTNKAINVAETGWPTDVIMHQGVNWFWDDLMPADTAYAFPGAQMKLKVQPLYRGLDDGNPLKVSGEDAGILETEITRDPNRRQFLASCTFPGQLICAPRYFGRASKYSGAV